MSNNNNNNNLDTSQFHDFISTVSESREVGLIIAENIEERDNYSRLLEMNGLGKLSSVLKYKNVGHGWYVIADNDNCKEIYDFICQYPLTTVSFFDSKTADTVVINPDYKHPVIVLIEKDALNAIQKRFDLLGRVGITYRTSNF
jgi:hypothetical protein